MRKYKMTPRGIGANSGDCFVCGKSVSCGQDFSSFVPSKETGEAILNLCNAVGCSAKLDFRVYEPEWIQIKIVGCDDHQEHVKKLFKLVSDGQYLDAGKLVSALKCQPT